MAPVSGFSGFDLAGFPFSPADVTAGDTFYSVEAHVQGVRLNHAIFASEEVIFSRLEVKDGQKCPLKDSNVPAIMLTTPCRVSGDPQG
jgi:hypothetical protein